MILDRARHRRGGFAGTHDNSAALGVGAGAAGRRSPAMPLPLLRRTFL